jgi:outer membrane protein, heavy metal efflux system
MSAFRARALRAAALLGSAVISLPAALASAEQEGDQSPLTLERVVEAALERNPELGAFAFELRAAQARERQAALHPAAALDIDAENVAGSGGTRGVDAAEFTLALSQVLELGGKRSARIDAARAGTGLVSIERAGAQLDVLAEVARRFIDVVERQALVDLARTASELAQNTVTAAERRVSAAKAPHVELDRARIALSRARLDEQAAVYGLEAARLSLAATWGESRAVLDGRMLGPAQADLYALPEPGAFPDLMERLLANPDFLRFASEARLRDAELRLAASRRGPDVTVAGGVRRFQESGDTAAVASLSLPLFSGSRAASFVAEAEAGRGMLDAQRTAALVKARAALFELHQRLRYTVLEAKTLKETTQPQMAEALQETQYAFDRGRYSYLELRDAQREYLDVQRSLIESTAEAHRLRAEIERLTSTPFASDSTSIRQTP